MGKRRVEAKRIHLHLSFPHQRPCLLAVYTQAPISHGKIRQPLISLDRKIHPFILQSQELDQKIAETWKHIQTERKILEGAQLIRQATSNQDVLRRNEAKIRETERSLAYFEDTLRELQARKAQIIQRDDPSRFPGGSVPQV